MTKESGPDSPLEPHQLISVSRDLVKGSRGRITVTRLALAQTRERLHDARNVLQGAIIARWLRNARPR